MAAEDLDALVIGDPANMNWLTGFDAWSFYVPQIMLVLPDHDPIWMGREMDARAVYMTTYLGEDCVQPYPELYVQRAQSHPNDVVAGYLIDRGLSCKRIGYESDAYFFSPKALNSLQSGLPDAHWVDADLLVNWCRAVKSKAEITLMHQAARLVQDAMSVAYASIAPGVRQCDLVAKILAAQVAGNDDFGGDLSAICPLILAGEGTTTAHPMWTDEQFEANQIVALELGGARRRYHAGLARTVQLGTAEPALFDTAAAVEEGLNAVMDVLRPGISAGDAHHAWQTVSNKYGLVKDSRIGYGIGVGYPPDWGEHTISLRAGEETELCAGMTLHVMLGIWMADWGMEISETALITDTGAVCLTQFPRAVHIVD